MSAKKRDAGGNELTSLPRQDIFDADWLRRVTQAADSEIQSEGMGLAELEAAKLRALFRTAFSRAPIGMSYEASIRLLRAAVGEILSPLPT